MVEMVSNGKKWYGIVAERNHNIWTRKECSLKRLSLLYSDFVKYVLLWDETWKP